MATMTLLEMTQEILSSLDSDEVNSIGDTVEAQQVAKIIKRKYYDILARGSLPEQEVLFQLVGSADAELPVLMTMPEGTSRINWIKYFDANPADSSNTSQFSHDLNLDIESSESFSTTSTTSNSIGIGTRTFIVADAGLSITAGAGVLCISGTASMLGTVTSYVGTDLVVEITSTVGSGTFDDWVITDASSLATAGYKYVTMIPIDQFVDYVNRFNPTDSNIGSYTFTEHGYDFTLYYQNNQQPRYCTVIENTWVLFDSYDTNFDSTLQGSKSMVFGQMVTPFVLTDTHVPDIDDQQFPLLLNEAKALAFYEMKQTPHPIATQEIKRQWSVVQKNKSISNKPTYFQQLADFGRVPRTGGYSGGGYGAYKWMRQVGP